MNTLNESLNIVLQIQNVDLLKIFVPPFISFIIGMFSVPFVLKFMARYNLQKKKNVQMTIDGKPALLTAKIDNDEGKVLYRMGAIVVFVGLFGALAFFRILPAIFSDNDALAKLNFLSRSQTWMPIAALLVGATVGALDDLIVCGRLRRFARYIGDGLSLRVRMGFALLIALVSAWWMTTRLDLDSIYIPFAGMVNVGWLIFSVVVVVAMVVTYAGSVIDGVDGLSGGVFSIMYMTMGLLAFLQSRYDLAALCFAIVGGLLAFLWHNIPPAKFMLSDVGSMPLTLVLAIIAILTDSVAVLPILSAPLIWSIGSVVLQLLSKKFRGKKIFLAAPVHIHLQLIGWPKHMVSMRYWIMTALCCSLALVVFVAGGYFG
jgi:phospho-N-acetylmuramoyl-pentapeptide-transferase